MTGTGQVLRRLMLARGDKIAYIAALVGTSPGAVSNVISKAQCSREVPDRWLPLLTPEYAQPLIKARINQHKRAINKLVSLAQQLLARKERAPEGGTTRALQLGLDAQSVGTARTEQTTSPT